MIDVQHITKEFVSAKKYPGLKGAIKGLFSNEKVHKVAVDDVSFHINKGEIVGYIGSNGAGKSTTIKMMTGILTPTNGTCVINGVDPAKHRKKNAKNIGVVFGQRTQLWWDLPLSESYTILKEIYNVSDKDYDERMDYLNRVLGLDEFFSQPVRNLSLGQRMRADLGAALLHNPPVIYLNEPTIGLDLVVKDNIREAIKDINEKYGTTVILTTHDIGDIEELCNRIIIIDAGKKIYDGSLQEFIGQFFKMIVQSKADFLIGLIGFFLTQATGIAFLYLVFRQIPSLNGWTLNELIFIYGFAQIPRGIDHLFTDNIWMLAWQLVVSGRFDSYMLRPMNLFLQVIFEKLQPDALGELLVGTILVVTSCTKGIVIIDAVHILLFIVSIFAGALIYTSIKLLFASFAFWMKISGPVLYTVYSLSDCAKYPLNVYNKGVRFIITWIIPFAFVAYIPATYFLKNNINPFTTIGIECAISIILFILAYKVFCIGTKAYESAGN